MPPIDKYATDRSFISYHKTYTEAQQCQTYQTVFNPNCLSSHLMFRGSTNSLPESSDFGDIYLVDGETYAYVGGGWECLSREALPSTRTERRTIKIKEPSNCSNCNAPGIPENDKCPYCGTPYEREEIAY